MNDLRIDILGGSPFELCELIRSPNPCYILQVNLRREGEADVMDAITSNYRATENNVGSFLPSNETN